MTTIRLLLALTGSLPLMCLGDMGSIPFKKGIRISEPTQNAIIAWNGTEQLMYLQTSLSASEATKVLEVMPLPARPTVQASDEGVFKRCAFLLPRPAANHLSSSDPFGAPPDQPSAQVVERKLIGAHDIRVVELLDADRFEKWIVEQFGETGDIPEIPKPLLAVIDEYASEGFRWFLFDVVDVKKELAKKTPLQIRFQTDHLYYPMRITRTEKGNTTVSLSILTNVLFDKEDCVGIPRESITVPAKPRQIPGNKVYFIDPPLFQLLGSPEKAMLRSWTISAAIDSFEKDLLIRNPLAVKQ
ncbi:MAG: DUF2330 domain-containing protein [Verrucomicrobiales bacterium]|nr:DUF2330 domain-containing protein [Verrucomicrobiales bacterium]